MLGTSRTFDLDPTEPHADELAVARGFLAAGGSLIDSSPMYGRAEELVGSFLRRLGRDDVFFATKVWTPDGREAGIRQMEASREKMGAPRIDLMQVHNLVDYETHVVTLREWKEQGRIRYLGITEMRDLDRVVELIEGDDLDFVQVPYSIANRAVEERVLPAALAHGVGVLVMRPFERGELFDRVQDRPVPDFARELGCATWAQLFLKFVLGHPAVTCPIPATSKLRHLADNMGAGVGPQPDERARKRMVEAVGL